MCLVGYLPADFGACVNLMTLGHVCNLLTLGHVCNLQALWVISLLTSGHVCNLLPLGHVYNLQASWVISLLTSGHVYNLLGLHVMGFSCSSSSLDTVHVSARTGVPCLHHGSSPTEPTS